MQINYTGRNNLEITPSLKEHTAEKLERIKRRDDNIKQINIIFYVQNADHIAEGTFHLKGTEFHASAKSVDMYIAIDELVDKLLAQITKHKEKMSDRHRKAKE